MNSPETSCMKSTSVSPNCNSYIPFLLESTGAYGWFSLHNKEELTTSNSVVKSTRKTIYRGASYMGVAMMFQNGVHPFRKEIVALESGLTFLIVSFSR